MPDALETLSATIRQGLGASDPAEELKALFGGRYQQNDGKQAAIRAPFSLGRERDGVDNGVPWAGLLNADNPTSGAYGGTSVVWFPTPNDGSLLTFVVGTGGLMPDEGILTRPGHKVVSRR